MAASVFETVDYKSFFLRRIEEFPNEGRGVRRQLAEAMGCQVAYVSHVLAGDKDFSLEQAEAGARFFLLRDEETEFVLILVEYARAGTKTLRQHFKKQIDARKAENNEIKNRIHISNSISLVDQAMYYSSWHYQAIHSLLTIPEVRSVQAISERLAIESGKVNQVLTFLLKRGLVKETSIGFEATQKEIHLPRTSPLISKLHTNWRVRSLPEFDNIKPEAYHYSGLMTLAQDDIKKVREILMIGLSKAIDVVKASREERLCLLAMDFFEL